MSRIWNTVYTTTRPDTNASYAAEYQPIEISTGNRAMVQVACPPECQVGRIVVKQLSAARDGGTPTDFTVTLYNLPVIPVSDDTATAVPDCAPMYEVSAPKSALAGNVIRDFTPDTGGDGLLFRNAEGDYTLQKRYLYVLINPVGAVDATKWEMAFSTLEHVGDVW